MDATDYDTFDTPLGVIGMRPATPADADAVLAILDDAARWLQARGIDQWRPGGFSRGLLDERIAHGEVHLATLEGEPTQEGEPIGTLTLQWADPLCWGDRPADAGYVHRLAIRRAYAHVGLGRALLGWAEHTIAAAGRPYLRLDCMADNDSLRRYYERAGFISRGETGGQGWRARLYEKRL